MSPPPKRLRRFKEPPRIKLEESENKVAATKSALIQSSPPDTRKNYIHVRPSRQKSKTRASQRPAQANTVISPLRATSHSYHSNAQTDQDYEKIGSSSPERPKPKDFGSKNTKKEVNLKPITTELEFPKSNFCNRQSTVGDFSRQALKEASIDDLDLISDWDEDDLEFIIPSSSVNNVKTKKNICFKDLQSFQNKGNNLSGSQKFLPKQTPSDRPSSDDTRPWAERFAPASLEELAVHKRKVANIKTWLEDVINGRKRKRILLLKGAAGTGMANPIGSISSSNGLLSMSAQFDEFLSRGEKFGQLELFATDKKMPKIEDKTPLDRRKSIILIEEFPNTFSTSSCTLQSFRSSILQYLTSNTPSSLKYEKTSSNFIVPVILVVSETRLTTSTSSADSFTAHRLLGPDILQHPGLETIEMNPIAPTIMTKALETIVQKESRKSGRKKTPGIEVLKRLGEVGDIRSAISSLEFLCLRGDIDGDWSASVEYAKNKKIGRNVPLSTREKDSLDLVTRREASLGIFHAVGKVVYNRREELPPISSTNNNPERLPDFLSTYSRPRRSLVSINELIDETGTDTQTFIATLHENYILSCNASPACFEFTSLDHINGCIDAISDSDLLYPSWYGSSKCNGFNGSRTGAGTSSDVLRRDEISFQVAVRGLLFSLPQPVTRMAPAAVGLRSGKAGEAHSIFYPTDLKLGKVREEIEGTIDILFNRLLKNDMCTNFNLIGSQTLHEQNSKTDEASKPFVSKQNKDLSGFKPPALSGSLTRSGILLERLPYMTKILKSRRYPTGFITELKQLERVTIFTGIAHNEQINDEDFDGDEVGENWATDEPGDGKSLRQDVLMRRGVGNAVGLPVKLLESKLVIIDDDIED
ncbi:cell cycle checkpoint protein RAD17 [Blumeria hordei DH14]|uniref:Cell cycle checkpoint protein RAD17 n=1 Tax=Blumeria graminis f. sp. hordei (strain DH14) TaxID=546991 RepID=N1JGW4_BLUG1|nr:cell cycle checkpoint protein RAD17 [Blumeria hordei DH14]